jgi:hypothetical protein
MTLADEAQLYLAVVEVFRAEGHEPHWSPEWLIPPPDPRQPPPAEPRRKSERERST